MKYVFAVLLAMTASSADPALAAEQYLLVTDQVQDIRKEPVAPFGRHGRDKQQQTQVLYNDVLVYKGENQHWYLVEVPDQQRYAEGQWQGYPGWILKKSVRLAGEPPRHDLVVKDRTAELYARPSNESPVVGEVLLGTKFGKIARQQDYYLVTLPDGKEGWIAQKSVYDILSKPKRQTLRERLTRTARLLAGDPYLLGGRSVPSEKQQRAATGMDCSGLVSLIFRVNGVEIPRDAQDQWRAAEQILVRSVKPGDLIFLSEKSAPDSIQHVMLYLGDDTFIEVPESGKAVRIGKMQDRFGVGLKELTKDSVTFDARNVYFGRVAQLGYAREKG